MPSLDSIQPAQVAQRQPDIAANTQARIKVALWLSVMMLGAAALSVWILSHQSLRLDEAQSLWQASHSPERILEIVAQDVHVPLYHVLLHFWMVIFGSDVAVARYLSLGFFLLTVPAVYMLARLVFARAEALLAAGLVALSPFMNWYGNEIRMYTLLVLVSVLSHFFFLRIYQGRSGMNWLGYTLTAITGIYTHYFFALVLLVQGVFFLVRRPVFPPGSFRRLAGVAIIIAAALAPWLWYVQSEGSISNTKPMLSRPTSVDLFDTFSQFLFGFQDERVNTFIVSLWPLTILLSFLALQKRRRMKSEIGYMLAAALLPVMLTFFVSLSLRPFYLSRYLIVALPPLYIFLIWVTSSYSKRMAFWLRALLIAAMMGTLTQQIVSANTPVKENYRAASQYLEAHAQASDIVIVSAPFTIYPLEYYYRGPAQIQTLPRWSRDTESAPPVFDKATLAEEVSALKDQHTSAWLLLSYDQGYEKDIKDYFNDKFELRQKRVLSPKLTLYEYKLRYDIPDTEALIKSLNEPRSQ